MLRQISHDGGVQVVDGVVLIGSEEIPLEDTEALGAALSRFALELLLLVVIRIGRLIVRW